MKYLIPLLLALTAQGTMWVVERGYGPDPRHRLDFVPSVGENGPLVLFIHGGAWSFGDKRMAAHMAAHVSARGYDFAAINYRLAPAVTVAQQAEDVAAAIVAVEGTHAQIFRRFGEPGHRATALTDAFVQRRFGAPR